MLLQAPPLRSIGLDFTLQQQMATKRVKVSSGNVTRYLILVVVQYLQL